VVINTLEILLTNKLNSIDALGAIDYAVTGHKEELEDLTTLELETGVDMEGKSLGSYARGYGLKVKGRLNPVDLKLTGSFHDAMKVKSSRGVIEMENTDGDRTKTDFLYENYGDDIVGLPREKVESGEVGEILLDSIIERITQQLDAV
jgi:Flp pilus assembly secretin CpaC